jgi:hypothetical protein
MNTNNKSYNYVLKFNDDACKFMLITDLINVIGMWLMGDETAQRSLENRKVAGFNGFPC